MIQVAAATGNEESNTTPITCRITKLACGVRFRYHRACVEMGVRFFQRTLGFTVS